MRLAALALLVACQGSRAPGLPDAAPPVGDSGPADAASHVDLSGMAPLRGTRACSDRPIALLVDLNLAHPRAALVADGTPVQLTEISLELLGEAQNVRRYRLSFTYEGNPSVAWIREERSPGGGRYAHTISAIGMTTGFGFTVGGTVP